MRPAPSQTALVVVSVLSVVLYGVATYGFRERREHPAKEAITRAIQLTDRWFNLVKEFKIERGLPGEDVDENPYGFLLGSELSEITTTLGSREAKTMACSRQFAGVFVRYLWNAGIDSSDAVGITLSGSFPSLAIACLAAVQALGAEAVVTSSLGASSYGANQPEATWIDLESYLVRNGSLQTESSLVTFGGEGDSGGGISEKGLSLLRDAVRRNGKKLYIPSSFLEAVETKERLFRSHSVEAFINIGGNQVSLGACPHAPSLPNGYHESVPSCNHENRGVMVRMAESGIPVIHMLNIRELALRHGIVPEMNGRFPIEFIGEADEYKKVPIAIALVCILTMVLFIHRSRTKGEREENVEYRN